jgi:hypothetical protein
MASVLIFTQNTITIVVSQYARYLEIFILYFIVKRIIYQGRGDNLLQLFYDIGLMQILLSIVKIPLIGWQVEGLVGSFSIPGGEMGTTIPILWFIILWRHKRGQFGKWDWIYILGLLLVGFTTGKRAVMFVLPVVVAVFLIYVPKLKLKGSTIAMAITSITGLIYVFLFITLHYILIVQFFTTLRPFTI